MSGLAKHVGSTLIVALISIAGPTLVAAQDTPEVAEGRVEAGLSETVDRDVERRLDTTFATITLLASVDAEVNAGVVRLSGIVDSASAKKLAGDLARQIEGVTAVENVIEENRSVKRRLDIALNRLADRAWNLLDGLPLFLVALGVLFGGVALARLAVSWSAPFRWLTPNVFLRDLAKQAVRVAIVIGGALIALDIIDATALVGAVLGAAGVAGLAIGFAFRDLVENYIASILLSVRRPFSPRDLVEIDGHLGTVARLTSRATILVTPDGNHVRIPNGIVFKSTILNYTRNPNRRFSFPVGVGTEENLVVAAASGTAVLESMKGVLKDPGPFCQIEGLGDSNVTLTFFGWVDQQEADFSKVRSEAIRLVKQAFDREEIEMPEPIQRVRLERTPKGKTPPATVPTRSSDTVGDISVDSDVAEIVAEERVGAEQDLLAGDGAAE